MVYDDCNDTEMVSVNKTNKRNRRRRRGKKNSSVTCPNAIPDTSLGWNVIVPSIDDQSKLELENKRLREDVEHLTKILATSVTELSKLEKELLDSEYHREILEMNLNSTKLV